MHLCSTMLHACTILCCKQLKFSVAETLKILMYMYMKPQCKLALIIVQFSKVLITWIITHSPEMFEEGETFVNRMSFSYSKNLKLWAVFPSLPLICKHIYFYNAAHLQNSLKRFPLYSVCIILYLLIVNCELFSETELLIFIWPRVYNIYIHVLLTWHCKKSQLLL